MELTEAAAVAQPDVAGGEHKEQSPNSIAPPPSSVLSDPPATDSEPKESDKDAVQPTTSTGWQAPNHSAQTEDLVKRISANAEVARNSGTPPWDAAREQVMSSMATSQTFTTLTTPPRGRGGRPRGRPRGRPPGRGRGGANRLSFTSDATPTADDSDTIVVVKPELDATPNSAGRSRGRGRGGGRPRGRGRGRNSSRGGKRKRNEDDDDDDDSDSVEEITPVATMTKSGRNVQKPTSFVPPPQPSPTNRPRKRPYNRRNPESAVCKACLRGTSPADNMIVFCDGCNTPYHRWCHKPPIDQAVIDEPDKEWYCRGCEEHRMVPVPESEIADFVSAEGASEEQRRKYFSSLSEGVLVTLLVKATTLKPDLPLFEPTFKAKPPGLLADATQITSPQTNGKSAVRDDTMPPPAQPSSSKLHKPNTNGLHFAHNSPARDDAAYTDEVHPPNYPRPGAGLMRTLPPEEGEELKWLVDDEDEHGVFSHFYQGQPMAAVAATAGAEQPNA